MKNHKSMEEVIVCAEIFGYGGPVLHREIRRIQQRVILNDRVENAITLQCASGRKQLWHC